MARPLDIVKISVETEIEQAIEATSKGCTGMVVTQSPLFGGQVKRIVDAATRAHLPVVYWQCEFAEVGGLLSYGPSGYRQAGAYVGRILTGAKRADLPVMQPSEFELIVNVKAAGAIGISVPSDIIAIADQVIE